MRRGLQTGEIIMLQVLDATSIKNYLTHRIIAIPEYLSQTQELLPFSALYPLAT